MTQHKECKPQQPGNVRARQLELLDNVADLLEPVRVAIINPRRVCNDQECHPLKQYNLVRLTNLAKVIQMALQEFDIRDERVYNGRPCLIDPSQRMHSGDVNTGPDTLERTHSCF